MRGGRSILLLAALLAGLFVGAAEALVLFRTTLRHRDVRSVAGRIQEELSPVGFLRLDQERNALFVTDEPARVDAVRALLQSLDVPPRRFALQTEFGVFAPPSGGGILREGTAFADATAWLERAVPVRDVRVVMDVSEGGEARADLLPGYALRAAAEGYDPTKRRLAFTSLVVTRTREGFPAASLLSGRAVLEEGQRTVFFLARGQEPTCRLAITPTLLPSGETREVP